MLYPAGRCIQLICRDSKPKAPPFKLANSRAEKMLTRRMALSATVLVELHCYEKGFGTGEESPVSVWVLPGRLDVVPAGGFESLKPEATRIIGPVALRVGHQVAASVRRSLGQPGITVEELSFPDD